MTEMGGASDHYHKWFEAVHDQWGLDEIPIEWVDFLISDLDPEHNEQR